MFKKSDQRKISLFITCLSVAVASWLFFALSDSYVYSVDTNVNFANFPDNKAFHPLQSDTVSLQIKGTGWQLLFNRVRANPRSVKVNLGKLSSRNYVTFAEQLREINKQFRSDQHVIAVDPDTLYFDFSARSVKRIPVKLSSKISFEKQFGLSGHVLINPAYVTVSGPKEELAKLNSWPTDSLRLEKVSSGIVKKLVLAQSKQPNVNIYPTVVDVRIPVDEFTEREIELPVRLLNNMNTRVRLLPSKVKVTYLTSLGNYRNSGKENFRAAVDMSGWSEKGFTQLPVLLQKLPPFIKVIRIEPQALDFMVKY